MAIPLPLMMMGMQAAGTAMDRIFGGAKNTMQAPPQDLILNKANLQNQMMGQLNSANLANLQAIKQSAAFGRMGPGMMAEATNSNTHALAKGTGEAMGRADEAYRQSLLQHYQLGNQYAASQEQARQQNWGQLGGGIGDMMKTMLLWKGGAFDMGDK